ncbi:MAG: molecular chaperone TorD family protein [Magnetococcales bacterium]|nr:molecular chaperone TorD family protein [Magnetococcales bacterium]MBF0149000.1 molecular chaperone TorD family protein [Magnetococcales bacterium]MBF0172049.1 molecular chaperone TorD family protein [Magnetococcales bacterium]MBF0630346.1 molecular chaperone TorD family protein [Magnetococcales bacterium]
MVNLSTSIELKVLAGLLAHPQGGALAELKDWVRQLPWLEEVVAELEKISLEQWQGEHTHLFLNGFPRTPAPPFMSVWNEGQMGGNTVKQLEQVYRDAGLEPVEGMPGDYLGTMLEFLAYLLENPKTVEHVDAVAFKERFLLPWIGRFISALRDGSELKLYKSLAVRLEKNLA